jgi:hypothetical protein
MKIRALRGVCIGVNQHLKAGDLGDVDAATFTFLKSIGAVELLPDAPVQTPKVSETEQPSTREKPGKKEKTT